MRLLEKARDLGQEIKASPEFQELKRTSQNIHDNSDAQQIVEEVQSVQQQIEFAQNSGIQPDQNVVEKFNDLKLKMDTDIIIQAYIKAQNEYSQLMQEVNNAINDEIYNS